MTELMHGRLEKIDVADVKKAIDKRTTWSEDFESLVCWMVVESLSNAAMRESSLDHVLRTLRWNSGLFTTLTGGR